MDKEDDIPIPSGMRREIERLKGATPPAPDEFYGRPADAEITPVLSPGQTKRPWSPPEEKPLLGVRPMPEVASVSYLELNGIGEGMTVLHAPSGVVGVVKKVHGPGEYMVAPKGVETSGRPVSEPVAELEDGNAFLLRRASFVVLGGAASGLHANCVAFFATAVSSRASLAAGWGVERETAVAVIRAALSAQLRALSEKVPDGGAILDKIRATQLASRYGQESDGDKHAHDAVVSDEVG